MNLSEQIKKTGKGKTLEILYGGEFAEKLLIRKAITIRAVPFSATIVSGSPTVSIESKNVRLENLFIICNDENSVCLWIKKGVSPCFQNVFVRGEVKGVKEEEGHWEIPDVLEFGFLEPNKINRKKIIIHCPVPAAVYSLESFLSCTPDRLKPGINEIEIRVEELLKDTFITPTLIIETAALKLKRTISLTGHTLTAYSGKKTVSEKYLWICESAKLKIHTDMLANLPEGMQGQTYEYKVNKDSANIRDFHISVNGLPEGISFQETENALCVKGISQKSGTFQIQFLFRKNALTYRYESNLLIKEKPVIPLKISPLKNPVEAVEEEEIRIRPEVLSSNSQVRFTSRNLPKDFVLNETSGEIYGKIVSHGGYRSEIMADDGTNQVLIPLSFYVLPKMPLHMDMQKEQEVHTGHEFSIPIIIQDDARLNPQMQIICSHPEIALVSDTQGHFIRGRLSKPGKYEVQIQITDTYGRKAKERIFIACIEKPVYNITWLSSSVIRKKGVKGSHFSEKIEARVNEDRDAKLKYTCKNPLPAGFHLSEDGWLHGTIDDKTHSLSVIAECRDVRSEKKTEIITESETSNILNLKGADIVSNVFAYKKQEKKASVPIKKILKKGKVGVNYSDTLMDRHSYTQDEFYLTAANLPPGLHYNPDTYAIEGIPEKQGLYCMEIGSSIDQISEKVNLLIEPSAYYENETIDLKQNSEAKARLGKAFEGWKK